jgi:3-oxoacyl-[acyl-carrier protein] reductase
MSTQNQNTNNGGNPNLAGKVAVVTGASKGIGAATAKRLAAAGAAVVVNYATSKADADKVVAEIVAQGGRAVAVQGDVSKRADATSIIEAAVEKFGRLDILVNNSGIYKLLPLADLKEEDFHRHFNVNVLGVLLTTQAALKHLPEGGSIVNISSGVTTIVPANSAIYTGTKGALDAITGVLSRELGPKKIRVNSVNPGVIQTEGTVTAGVIGSEFETWAVNNTPLGRIGQPDDIADIVVFLASDASRWLTGEQLLATGGMR